ncbi:hypothetical protein [Kitasatospora sp. NBC_01266]|uniref:hypothetical protein n=1 Tax=Kitasatospora sp. NBC_01266 TaxID=2903572 RepID=UPI002E3442BF|nr:hypothetical protein [Kitasatospora sp. NBC_01266]
MRGTSSRGQASPNSVRIAYAVGGLLFGAAWALGRGDPWWEHLVRVTVLLLAVVPPAQLLRRRQARRGGARPGRQVPIGRLVLAKLVLLAVALAAGALLGRYLADPDLPVAAGITLVVAFGGPRYHRRQTERARVASGE